MRDLAAKNSKAYMNLGKKNAPINIDAGIRVLEEPPVQLDKKAEQRILNMVAKQEMKMNANIGRCFMAQ